MSKSPYQTLKELGCQVHRYTQNKSVREVYYYCLLEGRKWI